MKSLALAIGLLMLSCAFLLAQNPVADKDSTAPRSQNNQGQSVGGKTHTGHPERQVTTTGSVGQTTPGAETEAGVEQAPGANSDVPHTGPSNPKAKSKTIQPPNPNDPGQTANEADISAQAASRAEIQPGTTLGVNATSNTAANAGSASAAKADLPQSDSGASGAKKAPAKKRAQPKKPAASTPSESKQQ